MAICINQDDIEERNTQIAYMKDIYSWAQPVYIWLGPNSERSDRAIDVLQKASRLEVCLLGVPLSIVPNPCRMLFEVIKLIWAMFMLFIPFVYQRKSDLNSLQDTCIVGEDGSYYIRTTSVRRPKYGYENKIIFSI